MRFNGPFRIILIGAGGTGGYVVPHLARIICTAAPETTMVIVDGDAVEERNVLRQNFVTRDLGKNKARVLAERYGNAFGIRIKYSDRYVTEPGQLYDYLHPDSAWKTNILIGCVDNNRTRRVMHHFFLERHSLVYVDAGNEEFDGQVVMGVRIYGMTVLPSVGQVYPDILTDVEEKPASCADADPQNVMANVMAAAIVCGFLNDIIALGECNTHMVTFNCKNLIARPTYIEEGR